MKRKGLKIALATIACIFNLFVCFSGVIAWFTASQKNETAGMQVQMYTHELDMSYRVFKYSDDEKAGVEVTGQQDALELQKYDSVITSRNENTPIILEFLLSGMDLGENLPINITTSRSQSDSTVQAISNIIKLQFAPLEINSDDGSVIYDTAVSYFRNQQDESIFEEGETEVTYELTNYSSHLTSAGLTLFIMLDYSEELIEKFKDNFDITDSTTVAFSNDLLNIVCATYEN